MIISQELARYIAATYQEIVFRGNPNSVPTTNVCPECGETINSWTSASAPEHLMFELTSDVFAILVGCEGYWVINPNLVGLDTPGWSDGSALGDPAENQDIHHMSETGCPDGIVGCLVDHNPDRLV